MGVNMYSATTIIDFISKSQPTPVPEEVSSLTGQTGDTLGVLVAILMVVIFCACSFFIWKRHPQKVVSSHVRPSANSVNYKNLQRNKMLTIFAVLALAVVLILGSFQATKALAKNYLGVNKSADQTQVIDVPEKIHATVDEYAGTITIDNSYLKNTTAYDFNLNSVATKYCDGIEGVGVTWTINAFDEDVYDDVAGRTIP